MSLGKILALLFVLLCVLAIGVYLASLHPGIGLR